MDDKAYSCPDTSTGMAGARNIKVFQRSDENKARKLPKYDFPTAMVNMTQGTYRIMSKNITTIAGNDEIETVDKAYVFVRPKYFVWSSGSVWASELMKFRHEVPHKFEICSEIPCSVSTESRSIYFMVKDSLSYFTDPTEKEHIMNIKYDKTHNLKGYEIMRCSIVLKSILQVFDKYETGKLKMTQKNLTNHI